MFLFETSKFQKLRKKLKDKDERAALREAVLHAIEDPESGKRLKGEFQDLRSLRFSVRGQALRLIYKCDGDKVILFSFGPRQGVYK
jgi:mRNA-degrading endonuclease RelE of RelBE toxin-antitoxin system